MHTFLLGRRHAIVMSIRLESELGLHLACNLLVSWPGSTHLTSVYLNFYIYRRKALYQNTVKTQTGLYTMKYTQQTFAH